MGYVAVFLFLLLYLLTTRLTAKHWNEVDINVRILDMKYKFIENKLIIFCFNVSNILYSFYLQRGFPFLIGLWQYKVIILYGLAYILLQSGILWARYVEHSRAGQLYIKYSQNPDVDVDFCLEVLAMSLLLCVLFLLISEILRIFFLKKEAEKIAVLKREPSDEKLIVKN